jgi:hypothetical protein
VIIFALVIVVVLGLLALAIDMGSVYDKRREMQALADSLAVAGASEALRNADEPTDATVISLVTAAVNDEATAMGLATTNVTVTTNRTTRDGASSMDVTVEARGTYTPYLLRLFGVGSMPVSASATAGSVGVVLDECLFAMDPRKEKTVEFKKNSKLSAPNCGVYVASTGKRIDDEGKGASVKIDGSASVTTYSFSTVGAISGPDRITITGPTGAPLTQVPVRADPVGGIKRPTGIADVCTTNDAKSQMWKVTKDDSKKAPYQLAANKTYCGIEVGEEADVVLQQGVYILKDKGIVVKKKASLVGDKVTFFLTASKGVADKKFSPLRLEAEDSKDEEWTEDFKVSLSAPTIADSADYAGILMFQDMSILGKKKNSPGDWGGKLQLRTKKPKDFKDCGTKDLKDCQTLKLEGLVHIPGMGLVVGKTAGFVGERTLFVARSIKLEDDASMTLNASTTTWPDGTPFRRVTLLR